MAVRGWKARSCRKSQLETSASRLQTLVRCQLSIGGWSTAFRR